MYYANKKNKKKRAIGKILMRIKGNRKNINKGECGIKNRRN